MSTTGGKRLAEQQGGKRIAAEPDGGRRQIEEPKKKHRSPLPWVILIIVLLLAAAAVWAWKSGLITLPAGSTAGQTEIAAAESAAAEETAAAEEAAAVEETEAPVETEAPADGSHTILRSEEDLDELVNAGTLSRELADSGSPLLSVLPEDYIGTLVYVDNYGMEVTGTEEELADCEQVDACVVSHLHDFLHDARFAVHPTQLAFGYIEYEADSDEEQTEHATGLAVDLTYFWDDGGGKLHKVNRYTFASDSLYADDVEWLTENAPNYGFVQSCDTDAKGRSLAFHFVYVGTAAAEEITENNWTLEEYVQSLSSGN